MKKLFSLCAFFILVGCEPDSQAIKKMWEDQLPPGSIIINTCESKYQNWAVWKYKGQCFISSSGHNFSTTKIDCII